MTSYKIKKGLGEDAVSFLSFADFDDQDENHYGLNGSATQVERIFPPEKNDSRFTLDGSSEEQSQELFKLLCDKKMI